MIGIANKIEVGRRVRIHLAYGHQPEGVIVAVHGEPGQAHDRRIGPMTIINHNACRFELVTFDGMRFDSRESCIGRPGIGRVDLLDKVHGPRLIEIAKAGVIERQAREAMEAAIAKQQFADAVEKVKADNPHLLVAEGYAGATHVAKNIRIALKHAGIKAKSVRKSDGNAIYVDLPHDASDAALEQAEAIAKRHKAGHFNGMEDIYEYNNTPFGEAFGTVRFVIVSRERKYD